MSIRVANAPVSWGIYEFAGIAPKFPFGRVLDEIAATGYQGIELGPYGYLPTEPNVLRDELQRRNLKLLSAFVPVPLVDEQLHDAAMNRALKVGKLLAALDALFVVLADDNGKAPELRQQAGRRTGSKLSPAQWDVVAHGVNHIAQSIHDETGLQVVFHHHCAGYVETPDETRELMARTDPELVGLCLDTGHWQYAGGDAVNCVREFGSRVRYLHLKDCSATIAADCREQKKDYFAAVEAGVFCSLGEGDVDFPGVMREMEKIAYSGWAVVEQDVLTDDLDAPRRFAEANRRYLKMIGL